MSRSAGHTQSCGAFLLGGGAGQGPQDPLQQAQALRSDMVVVITDGSFGVQAPASAGPQGSSQCREAFWPAVAGLESPALGAPAPHAGCCWEQVCR